MQLVYCCGFRLKLVAQKSWRLMFLPQYNSFRDKFYSCVLYLVSKSDFSVLVVKWKGNLRLLASVKKKLNKIVSTKIAI